MSKKRILTGIQSSGRPHLGNILGAIAPAVHMSQQPDNESFFFIADLHSLVSIKDGDQRREFVHAIAAAWLAFGFDTDNNVFWRQSRVPAHTELAWHLNCFAPFPMLANAVAFKEKSEKLADVNVGLFTYPVLQAADILLYDAHYVPVGKDQVQHLEITRDLAAGFNHRYGEIFVVPEARVDETVMTIPGTDGQKMSKSYNNYIDIFLPEKQLRKVVMSIVTDSTPLEEPKNPDTDTVFKLYSLIASPAETEQMRRNYLGGNYGYGHAKQALYELMITTYARQREVFTYYMTNLPELERKLQEGEVKAREISSQVLERVRKVLGFA
jgi:tryptophanyl-tRNA synthetase